MKTVRQIILARYANYDLNQKADVFVKRHYPKAYVERSHVKSWIVNCGRIIGSGLTPTAAWAAAASRLLRE